MEENGIKRLFFGDIWEVGKMERVEGSVEISSNYLATSRKF